MNRNYKKVNDEFNSDVAESMNLDAIEYSFVKEFGANGSESYIVQESKPEGEESKNDTDSESKKAQQKENFDRINQKQQELRGPDFDGGSSEAAQVSSATSSTASTSAAQASTTTAVATGTSSVVAASSAFTGGITILAAVGVLATAVVSGVFSPDPLVTLKSETGSDYIVLDMKVSNLDSNVKYKIKVSNNTFLMEYPVYHEGLQHQIVTGLEPDTPYDVELVSDQGALGDKQHFGTRVYTNSNFAPKAIFYFESKIEFLDNETYYGVAYNVYISDHKNLAESEYLELYVGSGNTSVITNRDLDEKGFFSGFLEGIGNNVEIASKAFGYCDSVLTLLGEYNYVSYYELDSDVYYSTLSFNEDSVSSSYSIDTGQSLIVNTEFDNYFDKRDKYKINIYDANDNLVDEYKGDDSEASFTLAPKYQNIKIELITIKELDDDSEVEFERKEVEYSFEPLFNNIYFSQSNYQFEFSADYIDSSQAGGDLMFDAVAYYTYKDGTTGTKESSNIGYASVGLSDQEEKEIESVNIVISHNNLELYERTFYRSDDDFVFDLDNMIIDSDNNITIPYELKLPEGASLEGESGIDFEGATDSFNIDSTTGSIKIEYASSSTIVPRAYYMYSLDGETYFKNYYLDPIEIDPSITKYLSTYDFSDSSITDSLDTDNRLIDINTNLSNYHNQNEGLRIEIYNGDTLLDSKDVFDDSAVEFSVDYKYNAVKIKLTEIKKIDDDNIIDYESYELTHNNQSLISDPYLSCSDSRISFSADSTYTDEEITTIITITPADSNSPTIEPIEVSGSSFSYTYGEDIPNYDDIDNIKIQIVLNSSQKVLFELTYNKDDVVVDQANFDVDDDGNLLVPYEIKGDVTQSEIFLEPEDLYTIDKSGILTITYIDGNSLRLEFRYNEVINGYTVSKTITGYYYIDYDLDLAYYASYYSSQLHAFIDYSTTFNGKDINAMITASGYDSSGYGIQLSKSSSRYDGKYYDLGIDVDTKKFVIDGVTYNIDMTEYRRVLSYQGEPSGIVNSTGIFLSNNGTYYFDTKVADALSQEHIVKRFIISDGNSVEYTDYFTDDVKELTNLSSNASVVLQVMYYYDAAQASDTKYYVYEQRTYNSVGNSILDNSETIFMYNDDSSEARVKAVITKVSDFNNLSILYDGIEYEIDVSQIVDSYEYDDPDDKYSYIVRNNYSNVYTIDMTINNVSKKNSVTLNYDMDVSDIQAKFTELDNVSGLGSGEIEFGNFSNAITLDEIKENIDINIVDSAIEITIPGNNMSSYYDCLRISLSYDGTEYASETLYGSNESIEISVDDTSLNYVITITEVRQYKGQQFEFDSIEINM